MKNREYVIGTFNLKNDFNNKNWLYEDYAMMLSKYIMEQKIDFIGVQELVKKYEDVLSNNLEGYSIYGDYRYKNIGSFELYDESVGIITNRKCKSNFTKYLSIFPSIPRIMSVLETGDLMFANVHLDHKSNIAKKLELKKLYRFIYKNKDKNIILLGDFNMFVDNKYFSYFVSKLKQINIKLVNPNDDSFSINTIDYIFLSSKFEVIKLWSDKKLMSISDHRPVFAKIKLND